jgi:transcriptional regulator of acetoin/glycerol metabolism
VLCDCKQVGLADLPLELRAPDDSVACSLPSAGAIEKPVRRGELTEAWLRELLETCDWNKAEVARRTGLSRTAIWKYMKKWNIPLQRQFPQHP